MTSRYRIWPITLLVAAFVVLSLAYSIATPIFEAPDEPEHFFYARYLAETGRLPLPEKDTLWAQEATQPPLYYALAAVPIALVDTSDAEQVAQRNPHAAIGIPLYPDNKNAYVHTPRERFPWQGTVLAVHLARFLSVLLGAATVWITYMLGLDVGLGLAVSLGAAAIVAFVPQFGFISAAVNNDNLVTALSALTVWMLVRHLRQGSSARRALVLGLLIGLATLAKLSGAGLLALCVVAYLWYAWRRKDRAWLRDTMIVVVVWLGITCWWFARNHALYGDLTGTARMLDLMGSRTNVPNLPEAWDELRGLVWSFWGLFGWFNVLAPYAMYKVFNVLTGATIAGWIVRLAFRKKQNGAPMRMAWPALWALILTAGLAQWTARTVASQGRLLFPALPAIALILAAGWSALVPSRLRAPALGLIAAAFLFWTARAPLFTILAAYAPPHMLAEDALPDAMKRLDAVVGDVATLVGYQVEPDTLQGGDELAVTLCWRPLRQTDANYSVYVHLLGGGQMIVGQRDTYPGGGSLATSIWEPGTPFCDAIRIPIAQDAAGPSVLRMTAGLYDLGTRDQLPVFDGWGRATTIMEEVARLTGGDLAPPKHPTSALIAGEIELIGWDAAFQPDKPNQVQVTFRWRAVTVPSGDYTVFVHLLDAEGNPVSQHDGVPVGGDYPTHWWLAGGAVEDAHLLEANSPIPPGQYMIKVGMYRTDNPEQRLSVSVGGVDVLESRVLLGPIVVN
jgi:4-amino-4-deoxy-L-arabinose transferase-like glycosyltransferase